MAASVGLALASVASAQPSQPPRQSPQPGPPNPPGQAVPAEFQPAQIDRNGVLILVRSTLLALHHANQTGNYTVLRDLGAPGFQTANTAARLAEIFASQRAQSLDLSGVVVLEPQLTRLPTIVQGGLMHMSGFFPSVPLQVNFELLFAPVDGRWKLFGLSLNVGQTGPTAPQAPEPPKPEPPKPEAAKPDDKPVDTRRPAERPKPVARPARSRATEEPAAE